MILLADIFKGRAFLDLITETVSIWNMIWMVLDEHQEQIEI